MCSLVKSLLNVHVVLDSIPSIEQMQQQSFWMHACGCSTGEGKTAQIRALAAMS